MSSIIKVDTVQDIDGNNIINENADGIDSWKARIAQIKTDNPKNQVLMIRRLKQLLVRKITTKIKTINIT